MERNHQRRSSSSAPPLAHRFTAEGYSPFIKISTGCRARWELDEPLRLNASGGLVCSTGRMATIGSGTFRIAPMDVCRLTADYGSPVYLIKYSKLRNVLRNRYEFELLMGQGRRENLWPHLFDYFMKTGEWPLKRGDYAKIFRRILSASGKNRNPASRRDGWMGLARSRIASAALTRIDRARSAGRLAANAGHITHRLLSSEFYGDLLAEVDMLRSLPAVDSIVPLAAEFVDDEVRIKLPFEVALPRRIMIFGLTAVDYRWEYGEFFDRSFTFSSLELYPVSPFALAPHPTISARRAHVPLDAGAKKVYGVTLGAPLICKGEKVMLEILKRPRRLLGFRRRDPEAAAAADPTNIRVRLRGIEA